MTTLHEIVTKYEIFDVEQQQERLEVFCGVDNTVIMQWGDESQAEFRSDVEVIINEDGTFSVEDIDGNLDYTFGIKKTVKVNLSDNQRAIDLDNVRIEITEPNRMWVKVGKFDVLLNHTEEGIVVDVWPWVEANDMLTIGEPLASCYAFDVDADDAIQSNDTERPDRDCDSNCSRRASPAAECDCSRSK